MSKAAPPVAGQPVHPEVEQHIVRPTDPVIGRVVKTESCTKGGRKSAGFVRHVAIDISGTPLAGRFRAGQSFGVVPPGTTEKGKPHKLRLYSMSNPTAGEDGQGNVISTSVKRVVDEHWDDHKLFVGLCSNYLCDLQEGDEVMVTGPVGKRFLLPEDLGAHDYIFFATGTGVAPFRSMVGDLAAAGMPSKAAFIMGSPYATDLIYDDHFKAMDAEWDNFSYITGISRETNPDCGRKLYVQERLDTHAEQLVAMLKSERTLVYICGIAGMELGIFKKMAELLDAESLSQYVQPAPEIAADPGSWNRKMIPRQLKPTKRMFLEVY